MTPHLTLPRLLWLAVALSLGACCKAPPEQAAKPAPEATAKAAPEAAAKPVPEGAQEVEVACGQCQFGIQEPKGCDLAVRIDGKAYFVDGSKMAEHGDAHGVRGMCNAIRKAHVTGQVVEGRFKAESLALVD